MQQAIIRKELNNLGLQTSNLNVVSKHFATQTIYSLLLIELQKKFDIPSSVLNEFRKNLTNKDTDAMLRVLKNSFTRSSACSTLIYINFNVEICKRTIFSSNKYKNFNFVLNMQTVYCCVETTASEEVHNALDVLGFYER